MLRLKETEDDMAGSDYILFTGMRDTDSPDRFDAPAVVSLSNQCISLREMIFLKLSSKVHRYG